MLLGLICNPGFRGLTSMRDCIAFVERNNSIATLASLVKLLIKLLTD